jgi:AraC-like DNA-binding protein
MELSDKVIAVNRMQEYIIAHLDEDITLYALAVAAGYSKYYAVRIFKELCHSTPFKYIRAMRLTKSARALRDTDSKVVDIAVDSGFDSHDGFTRAFARQFGITPQRYHEEKPPIPWFVHYSVEAYYRMTKAEEKAMEKERVSRIVTVTTVERPARKMILLRAKHATDYWTYCEEVGCDFEGLLNSIPEKYDTAEFLELPPKLVKPGTATVAYGVEIPLDYIKLVPAGYEMIELPPCTYLFFHVAPYENEEDFGIAHEILSAAMTNYNAEQYGWKLSDVAPCLTFSATAKLGVKSAVSVEKIT